MKDDIFRADGAADKHFSHFVRPLRSFPLGPDPDARLLPLGAPVRMHLVCCMPAACCCMPAVCCGTSASRTRRVHA